MIEKWGWAALLMVGAAASLPALGDDAKERAILVLDASGSMWGQVEGTPKITIARDVVQDLLGDWKADVELGVTAYGHREKGNCADIETLVPVGPVNADEVMKAIGTLNPKGKTPLTDAVRQAAEALKYTEERATVLLVSDGKETCDADPCAAAAELEADGIDFTVHVVGFDLTAAEKEQLQCVADETGGKFLSADSAPELHAAMATTVALVAEPEPEPAMQTGMKLQATLVEGGEPVKARFDIEPAERNVDGKRALVEREYSKAEGPAIVRLPVGDYVVTATHGQASRTVGIRVDDGEAIERTIVVPAGHLRLGAALSEGGEEVEARFDVEHIEQNIEGKRKFAARGYAKPGEPALFRLAEGSYVVTATEGGVERSFEVDVNAGERLERSVILGAGRLRLAAVMAEGGEPVRAHFEIRERTEALDDGESPDVTYVSGETVTTELPAGSYHVVARFDEAEVSRDIELKPGELAEETLVLAAGRLDLAVVLTAAGEPIGASLRIWEAEESAEGGRDMIAGKPSKPEKPAGFNLPAGSYRVQAIYGDAEVTGKVEVHAGEITDEVLVMNAGFLEAWGARDDDGKPMHARIMVYEAEPGANGKPVFVTGGYSKDDENAAFKLAAGRYLVTASDSSGNEVSTEIEVRPGERTEAAIVVPVVE